MKNSDFFDRVDFWGEVVFTLKVWIRTPGLEFVF